ncbi:aminomethyl-transferring glycine dehydrogenase subunit GcvPB [Tindallia californiensis]|uniref:Probable glycine dehydrogenase (decarboxylating) subunit 2 n=1 Tax=Tindallia californiensis TaxID=159292 RepID=A0A1H3MQZ7_9FIRM|nr:aminomethyl-transferring glycine dehydrogenase subunit GcvPB [Tindallia californiensis]SDY78930.1 glycine dehydrogenase subunit 2 [Tindallia californiensis]
MKEYTKLLCDISKPGRTGYRLPPDELKDMDIEAGIPESMRSTKDLSLPEVSELDVVRHFVNISQKNFAIDKGFYPLGSCTMKYNPKINEDMTSLPGFNTLHPYQPEETAQGALKMMYELQNMLAEITGMAGITLQPAAGAHGEMTGLMVIKAYHEKRGDAQRKKIIVPDSAHGTNPSSAHVVGYDVVEVKSNRDGDVDIESLKAVLGDDIAGLMLTNPSTLGLYERNITEIARLVHEAGGLLYYDGANANAILGVSRPGDMGFDVVHLNLHKTFSTPHGGGGPGSGPIGVREDLIPFLPKPAVVKDGDSYALEYDRPESIGKIHSFYGNFGVNVRAYTYIKTMGAEGLKKVSQMAVLNANYLMHHLKNHFKLPFDRVCMHEFVLAGLGKKEMEVNTTDVAKRLLDNGFHPPTVYFPLIVPEALMIEPTETECLETLDAFIEAMKAISQEADDNPDILKAAPHVAPVRRLDEVKAAREPVLKCELPI